MGEPVEELSQQDIAQLNQAEIFLSFIQTTIIKRYLRMPHKLIALFCGNQSMKTSSTAYSYVRRILGTHPVPEKNLDHLRCGSCENKWLLLNPPPGMACPCGGEVKRYDNVVRTIRFASETLPGQTGTDKTATNQEVKNTQYPEFKKWLPPFLIKKDITARNPAMTIADPNNGRDIVVEFVSYGQTIQSTAGPQRFSIWCDEQPNKDFYEEQLPRLLAADGDFVMTLTPADMITWTYDEIFDRASQYVRSKTIVEKFGLREVETIREDKAIGVVQAATDDNPTLNPHVVEKLFENFDDDDVIAIRRYGIFKQVSGRIFKTFDWNTHIIDDRKYFPDGIPWNGTHGRGIDYHDRTPWAVGWLYLSDNNELFIYDEYNPSPEQMVTLDIAREIAIKSGNRKYRLDLMDPLAEKSQPNTGLSVVDDMNRMFNMFKKEGICTGGYWQVWSTKGTRGRENIRERLKNSIACGKPFNNLVQRKERGEVKKVFLPTIWIFGKCKNFANSFKNWRWEEWATSATQTVKEEKNTPGQRWSHFPMVVEAFLKDNRFQPTKGGYWGKPPKQEPGRYFQNRRQYA